MNGTADVSPVAVLHGLRGGEPKILPAHVMRMQQRIQAQLHAEDYRGASETLGMLDRAGRRDVKIFSAEEIFAPLPEVKWLIKDLELGPGCANLFAGATFTGKTAALQSLAIAVAVGKPVWGMFPTRKGRVLHLDYEQGKHLSFTRYQRLARGANIDAKEFRGQLDIIVRPQVYLDSPCAEEFFKELFEPYDLVLIDSLRAAAPRIQENDSAARHLLDMVGDISEQSQCVPIFAHHARKKGGRADADKKENVRGSTAICEACNSVFFFEGAKRRPTRVHHEKARISGHLNADFTLHIEDVAIGDRQDAGLKVTARREAPTSHAKTNELCEFKDRILANLVELGPAETRNKLLARVGGNRRTGLHALRELIAEHKIDATGPISLQSAETARGELDTISITTSQCTGVARQNPEIETKPI